MSDGLFDQEDLNCLHCGRPLVNGLCAWCSASKAIKDEPAKRHHRPNNGGSRAGAYDVAPRAGTQKARLLAAFAEHGDLTAAEAATHAGIDFASAYWMRCSELRSQGLIEEVLDDTGVGVVRDGPMGSPQMVSRITVQGLASLRTTKEPHGDPAPTPVLSHLHQHAGPTSATCPACLATPSAVGVCLYCGYANNDHAEYCSEWPEDSE